MKKCPKIFIEEYAREDDPGKSRRLQKYVEKLYDIDLDDHSDTRPEPYRIDYCLEEEAPLKKG